MKTIRSLILSLVVYLLFPANVKAQDEIDTLYLFPDTTTFLNEGSIWIDDVSNLAIKLSVDETWDAFSIEKILAINIDTIGFTSTLFFISLGIEPQDSIIYNSGWVPVNDIYPNWTEFDILPPIKVENQLSFYVSGDLLFISVVSDFVNPVVQNEFWYHEFWEEWFEGIPIYFPVKVVVKRIMTNVNTDIDKQENFQLQQNYPNPFNGATIIEYIIKEESLVEISVYNMLGENITTLVNEEIPAGNHKINFEPKYIPSGIYLYRINAGGFISSRKMIYIK